MSDRTLKLISILLGLGLLLITGILAVNMYNGDGGAPESNIEGETPAGSLFPPTLQGLSLGQVESGPQAIAMISRLHGTNIAIKQGYIASYGGDRGQVTIWVSESNSEDEAKQLFQIMDDKIIAAQKAPAESGGPPFTDRRTLTRNGIDVVAVKGMGMENYYYQIKEKVYWIAVQGVDPIKTLEEALKTI